MNSPITLSLLSTALILFTASTSAGAPAGHPVVNEADRALHTSANAMYPNEGKALEVIQAGEYTYINIEKKGDSEWIAVAKISASKDDIIKYSKGSLMRDFHSKTLNRTFPEITFSGAAEVVSKNHPSIEETASILNIPANQLELPNKGKVVSTIPTSMYTYIEVSHNDTTRWLAAPSLELKAGDNIKYADGAVMTNFYSKTLDREFAEVLFISKVETIK
jgi:hypothetical protein